MVDLGITWSWSMARDTSTLATHQVIFAGKNLVTIPTRETQSEMGCLVSS